MSENNIYTDSLKTIIEPKLDAWVNSKMSRHLVVTIALIAKQIEVTVEQLGAYYDSVINIDFLTWLTKIRVKDAQEVIRIHRDWEDTRVATFVGFRSADELILAYKRINGMTPSAWRKSSYCSMGKMPWYIERIVVRLAPQIIEWELQKSYCDKTVTRNKIYKLFNTYEAELDLYYSSVFQTSFEKRLDFLRIEEAKRIISKHPTISSSEVADMVGYSSAFVFCQVFYNLVKQMPKEWKKVQGLDVEDLNKESSPFDDEPVKEWIQKKGFCASNLKLREVAKILGFSEQRLAQYILLTEDCSFSDWIEQLKLEEAKRLLSLRPGISMQDIEKRIGYSGRQPFTQWFFEKIGNNL